MERQPADRAEEELQPQQATQEGTWEARKSGWSLSSCCLETAYELKAVPKHLEIKHQKEHNKKQSFAGAITLSLTLLYEASHISTENPSSVNNNTKLQAWVLALLKEIPSFSWSKAAQL